MISSIELTVLGLISYKPMHGYKICHFFEDKGIDELKEIKNLLFMRYSKGLKNRS